MLQKSLIPLCYAATKSDGMSCEAYTGDLAAMEALYV